MSLNALFSPFQIKTLKLPNRIVMAPMTRSFAAQGVPTPEIAEYHWRRAEASVGLPPTSGCRRGRGT